MSRIKILTMLFISFLIGTAASVALYRYWVKDYHEQVLKPEMQQRLKTVNAAIELFAFNRTSLVNRHITGATKLLGAFEEPDKQKRRNRVHDELNVLHRINDASKQASLLAAVNMRGQAFVRADDPNWKTDWKNIKPVELALRGTAAHGFVMFDNKPMIFLAIPVIKQVHSKPKPKPAATDVGASAKKQVAAQQPKCPPDRRYICWRPCLKRNKHRKCLRYAKEKKCRCLRRRRRRKSGKKKRHKRKSKKKTGWLTPKQAVRTRLAQGAPDDRPTPAPATKNLPEIGKRAKQLGVVVLGYMLDDRLTEAVKSIAASEMAFVSTTGKLYGATLDGRMRERLAAALKQRSPSKDTWQMQLGSNFPYLAIRSPLTRTSSVGILILRPMRPIYELFQNYVLWGGVIGGITFLLALVLIFPGVNRFRRDLETIEDGVLETYNTGNLRISFNPNSAWLLGALATSLNKLYAQLRGEPDEEYNELKQSGDWDVEGLGVDERILSGTFNVPEEILEPNTASESAAATPTASAAPAATPASSEEENEGMDANNANDWIESLLSNPDAHYEEVFARYVAAKKELGEDTSRLKKDRFVQKLHKNAAQCMEQFEDCRGVLFDVTIKDNKVILKPQLIPKE